MKIKKLILSLCISIAVLTLGTSSVFAKNIPNRTKHVSINEYDMYKKWTSKKILILAKIILW